MNTKRNTLGRSNKTYTVGSLYSGIGGVCLGFQQSGAKVLWANEFDKNACVTYRLNFTHHLYEQDVYTLDSKTVPKVDILTSGFPCQAFSIAGYQKGFKDSRGNHFFETLRFINHIKPKAILLENVKNLKSHDKGNTFNVIKDFILNSGYSFISKVLNTKDFGDIPQNRERIFMIGFRDEDYSDDFTMNPSAICSQNFKFPDQIPLTKTIQDLFERKKVDKCFFYDNTYMYDELKKEMTKRDTVYQWRRMYVRENKSNVCPTLTANMGTGGHNVPLIKDQYGIRKLTPRECIRFQGFPESYHLPDIARTQLYKQIGNSVTVPLIKRIAEEIINSLNIKYKKKITRKDSKSLQLA
jgi:DNA (cytosine-5)-methyltransferase 1